MTLDLRLVAYAPDGARLALLPHPLEAQAAYPLDDIPSLNLTYSRHAIAGQLLGQPIEVATEYLVDGTSTWVEPPGGRFCLIKDDTDSTDDGRIVKVTAPGYAWLLTKVRLWPSTHDNDQGQRPFLSATAGTILLTLINEAKARGCLPGLAVDFTTTHDSANQPWANVLTIYYTPGVDIATALANLADQGVVDWSTQGRTLRMWNADTELARERTQVDLRLGRDITEAPNTSTLEDVIGRVLLLGDNGFKLELQNAGAPQPWGKWEGFITQGGVSDQGTATILAQAALDQGAQARVQITRGIALDAARWLPLADYRPGDYITAANAASTMERLRVRQVTLTTDDAGTVAGNLVLNDRFIEATIRQAKRTKGIVGGATNSGGGGGNPPIPPPPPGLDNRVPAAPEGLVVASTAYLDPDGAARAAISSTWSAVSTDENGQALEIARYELYQQPTAEPAEPFTRVSSVDAPSTTLAYSPYDVGSQWQFKVRAISKNNIAGLFSDTFPVTMATDPDAPPVPSTPLLSTRLGTIKVDWDGRASNAGPMPADFHHVDVLMEATTGVIWREAWPVNGNLPAPWQLQGTGSPAASVAGGRLSITAGTNVMASRSAGGQNYHAKAEAVTGSTTAGAATVLTARFDPPRGVGISAVWIRSSQTARLDISGTALRQVAITVPAGVIPDPALVTLGLTCNGNQVQVFYNNTLVHTETLTAAEVSVISGDRIGWGSSASGASVGPVELSSATPPAIWQETWPGTAINTAVWSTLTTAGGTFSVAGGLLTMTAGNDLLAYRDVGSRDYTITGYRIAKSTAPSDRAGVLARCTAARAQSWDYGHTCVSACVDTNGQLQLNYRGLTSNFFQNVALPAGSDPLNVVIALRCQGRQVTVFVDGTQVLTRTLTPDEDAGLPGTMGGLFLARTGAKIGTVLVEPIATAGSTVIDTMEGPGGIIVTGQPYNQPRSFWFRAVDRSGNASGDSAKATISTRPLVNPDLIDKPITGAQIVANSITTDTLAAGSITASKITADAIDTSKLRADAITAKQTITGSILQTSSDPNAARLQINPSGPGAAAGWPSFLWYPANSQNFAYANAVSQAGGSETLLGFNSGQWPNATTGRQDRCRLMLADAINLEVIRADNQARDGGYLSLGETFTNIGQQVATENNFLSMQYPGGVIRWIGKFVGPYFAANPRTAMWSAHVPFGAGFGSANVGYGATISERFIILCTIFDPGSTTTWTAGENGHATNFIVGYPNARAVLVQVTTFRTNV